MIFSRKPVFKPSVYETSRRRRKRMPRWLVILFTGVIIGAGGFWFLQTNYGPKRYTVEESRHIAQEISNVTEVKNQLQTDKQALEQELVKLKSALAQSEQEIANQKQALTTANTKISDLQNGMELLKDSFPKDPSNGVVGIRGVSLKSHEGQLDYVFFAMKRSAQDPDLEVRLEFVIQGRYRSGKIVYIQPDSIKAKISDFTKLVGTMKLPDTLTAMRLTVKIKNDASGKTLSTRTFLVSN